MTFSEEQGTELAIQRCLVSFMTVFGQLVHVRLGEFEGLLPQVVLAVAVSDVKQPAEDKVCRQWRLFHPPDARRDEPS